MDEPVVDVMADLLSAVTTVITNFASWVTSLTTSLIANPLIQLLFGMGIALLVTRFIVGLVKTASGRKGRKRR